MKRLGNILGAVLAGAIALLILAVVLGLLTWAAVAIWSHIF